MTATEPKPAAASTGGIDRALLAIASVVVLGTIMSILDTTVVNVAINRLATSFHTTLPTIQWVATGYTLALATVIPLTGWIADRFGTKRLYMGSIALFVIGSALSGISGSAGEIIVFRVLQGLGGGMIMPAGMIILTRAAGPERIGRVMAIIGVPMMIGPILGPVLGGWLVTDVGWRWIFFINAPIGVIALVLSARILARDVGSRHQKLDLIDLFLVSPGLAILIYGLAKSSTSGGFGSAQVLIPLAIGALLLAVFVRHALRSRQPLIDLRLFRDRTFATSSITLVLVAVSAFGSFLLLPLYFQWVHGETALNTGLLLIPQGVGSMVMMPVAGIISDKTGPGRIVPIGLIVMIASVLWLTGLSAHTSYVSIEADFLVFGIGMGLTMMPVFTGAVRTLREAAVARGSTALNILQQTGASIGTAVLSVVLYSALRSGLHAPAGAHGRTLEFGKIPAPVLHRIAPVMSHAFAHTFWWAVALLVVAFLASLMLPKSKAPAEAGSPPVFAAV